MKLRCVAVGDGAILGGQLGQVSRPHGHLPSTGWRQQPLRRRSDRRLRVPTAAAGGHGSRRTPRVLAAVRRRARSHVLGQQLRRQLQRRLRPCRSSVVTPAAMSSSQPGPSPGLKMRGGQQTEPLRGDWRRSPQRGSGAPGQGSSFLKQKAFRACTVCFY